MSASKVGSTTSGSSNSTIVNSTDSGTSTVTALTGVNSSNRSVSTTEQQRMEQSSSVTSLFEDDDDFEDVPRARGTVLTGPPVPLAQQRGIQSRTTSTANTPSTSRSNTVTHGSKPAGKKGTRDASLSMPGVRSIGGSRAHPSSQRATPSTSIANNTTSGAAREPLCIVGIGCRLPGGVSNPEELWKNLSSGVNSVVQVPGERWNCEQYASPLMHRKGHIRSMMGGFLQPQQWSPEKWDAEFFRLSPVQASGLDPQQRLLLELAYETFEDAGVGLDQLNASNTAVYMGGFQYDWMCLQSTPQSGQYSAGSAEAMGVAVCSLANRISYAFNLKGPSLTVDTACSGSLVAIHLACQAIWNGECTAAIAGGVNLMLKPESSILLSRGGFLSDQGKCASFDASGAGYVRGEGAGLLLIKPLSAALKEGNEIYSLINGTASNSDGFTAAGLTVPNSLAHSNLMRGLYDRSQVHPGDVSYMECHGTGTAVGDPIELLGLSRIFTPESRQGKPLVIGSIKSNIGHLEGGAGVAGMIKASLVLRKNQIPPNLHFETPNPGIPFGVYNFQVPKEMQPLPATPGADGSPCAAVNSFGAGGSNAHVILRQYRKPPSTTPLLLPTPQSALAAQTPWPRMFFFLSARSTQALQGLAAKYVTFLKDQSDVAVRKVCLSLFLYRTHFTHRLSLVAKDGKGIIQLLEQYIAGKANHAIVTSVAPPTTTTLPADYPAAIDGDFDDDEDHFSPEHMQAGIAPGLLSLTDSIQEEDGSMIGESLCIPGLPPPVLSAEGVVFVFSGQGGQWPGMGRSLLQSAGGKNSQRVFTDTLTEFDKHFQPMAGWSIRDTLLDVNFTQEELNATNYVQPLIAAVQMGLYHVWLASGIKPAGIIGHSIGEVAAAYAAGCISLADAAFIIWKRSGAQQKMEGTGKMLAVGVDHATAAQIVKQQKARLKRAAEVATINSSNLLTFSGDAALLDELAAHLPPGTFNKFVAVEVPYHSRAMEQIKQEINRELYCVTGKPVREGCVLYSTVTAERSAGTNIDAAYWYDNIRKPVLFTQTMENALSDGFRIFIEIGPHPVLQQGMQDQCDKFNKLQFDLQSAEKEELEGVHPPAFAMHSTLRNRDELSQISLNIGWTLLAIRRQLCQNGPLDFQAFIKATAPVLRDFFTAPEVQKPGSTAGVAGEKEVDVSSFHPQRLGLPGYSWARQSFWRELQEDRTERLGGTFTHAHPFFRSVHCTAGTPASITGAKKLGRATYGTHASLGSAVTFNSRVHTAIYPYLADHVVDGAIVFPATAHLEFVFGAAREIFNAVLEESDKYIVEVNGVSFAQACIVPSDDASPSMLRLECHIDSPFGNSKIQDDSVSVLQSTASTFALYSTSQHDNNEFIKGKDDLARALDRTWTKHSNGQFRILESVQPVNGQAPKSKPIESLDAIRARFKYAPNQDLPSFYDSLSSISAIQYGPAFQCIQRLCHLGDYIYAELQVSEETLHSEPEHSGKGKKYSIHPSIFDAALHASFIHCLNNGDQQKLYLPHSLSSLRLLKPLSKGLRTKLICLIHIHTYSLEEIVANFTLYDAETNEPVIVIKDLISKYFLRGATTKATDDIPKHAGRIHWLPVEMIEGTNSFVDLQRENLKRFYHYACRQVILFADRSRESFAKAIEQVVKSRGASIVVQIVWIQDVLQEFQEGKENGAGKTVRELITGKLKSLPLLLDKRTQVILLPSLAPKDGFDTQGADRVITLQKQMDDLDASMLFAFDLLCVLVTEFQAPFARFYVSLQADLPLDLPSSIAQLQCDLDLWHGGFFGLLRVFLAENPAYMIKTIISSLSSSSDPTEADLLAQASHLADECFHWKPELRELEIWYAGGTRRYVRTIRNLDDAGELSMIPWPIAVKKHYAFCQDESARAMKFVNLPPALLEVNTNPTAIAASSKKKIRYVVVRVMHSIQSSGVSVAGSPLPIVPYRLDRSWSSGITRLAWMVAGEITASEDPSIALGSVVIARCPYGLSTSIRMPTTNMVVVKPIPACSLEVALAVFYDQLLIAQIFGRLLPSLDAGSKAVILTPGEGKDGTTTAALERFLRQERLGLDVSVVRDLKAKLKPSSVQLLINTCPDHSMAIEYAHALSPFGSSFVQMVHAGLYATPLPPTLAQRLPTGSVQHVVDVNSLAWFAPAGHAGLMRRVATHLGIAANPSADPELLAPVHAPTIVERSLHNMVGRIGGSNLSTPIDDVHLIIHVTQPPSVEVGSQSPFQGSKQMVKSNSVEWREKTGVESWLETTKEAKEAQAKKSAEEEKSSAANASPSAAVPLVPLAPPAWHLFSSTLSYVITGGASGLGFELMAHMAKQGAKFFVLVSRSGIKDEERRARVKAAQAMGIKILIHSADISRAADVVMLFEMLHSASFQADFAPLGGIIHCAGLLDDQMMLKLSHANFLKVWQPKAIGGVLLHVLSEAYAPTLPFFVCISSIGALCGFVGQANYAAANAALDGLSAKRNVKALRRLVDGTQDSRLPQVVNTSINYGLLSDYAGMSNTSAHAADPSAGPISAVSVFDILESQGLTKMPLYDCLAKFDLAVCHSDLGSQMLASRTDWTMFAHAASVWSIDTTYQQIRLEAAGQGAKESANQSGGGKAGSSVKLSSRLQDASLSATQRLDLVVEAVLGLLHRLLGVTVRPDGSGALDKNTSIDLFGVDSLILSQMRAWITKEAGVAFPMMALLKGPTPKQLAQQIIDLVKDSSKGAGGSAAQAAPEGENGEPGWMADYKDFTLLSPWIVRGNNSPGDNAKVRLLCFHSMGASALLFQKTLYMPPTADVDVLAIQSPGRGHHIGPNVKRANTMPLFLEQLMHDLLPYLDRPCILWGHSFGGITAYEVIRYIQQNHPELVKHIRHLQTSGTCPPHLMRMLQTRDTLLMGFLKSDSVNEIVETLQQFADSTKFLAGLMPTMQLDLPLLMNYPEQTHPSTHGQTLEARKNTPGLASSTSLSPAHPPLPCSMTSWAGLRDDIAHPEEISEWSAYVPQVDGLSWELKQVDGDHWFINVHNPLIHQHLEGIIRKHA